MSLREKVPPFLSHPIGNPEERHKKEMKLRVREEIHPSDYLESQQSKNLFKRFFADLLSGMHEGKITEVFTHWLTNDIEWECKIGSIFAVGVDHCIMMYNKALMDFFGGPNSTVTFTVHGIDVLSSDRCKLTVISTVDTSETIPTLYEDFYVRFRGNKVSEILIAPIEGFVVCSEFLATLSAKPKLELPPPSITRPCNHNDWDSVRVKNQIGLLRCRVCTAQWKIKVSHIKKCNRYTEGMCNREECSYLHIRMRKQTRAELEQKFSHLCY